MGGLYEVTYRNGAVIRTRKYYAFGAQTVAMRENGVLYFLHGNNLGSASLTTDAAGFIVSTDAYYPFGASRLSAGARPTALDFTGQRLDTTGLHFYNARYYDSLLSRFVSADTVVPEPGRSQAYNRYVYSLSNPLIYTDPSGHNPILIIVLVVAAIVLTADSAASPPPTNYPVNLPGGVTCGSSLPNCFGDTVFLKDFSGYGEDNPMSIKDFEEFADKVAEDLYTHDLEWPGFESGRDIYDTPFYNGGGSEIRKRTSNPEGVYPADQQVCIETIRCSGRSDINYIAQGMWGAAVGEPKLATEMIATTWKLEEYKELPSEDTLFWLDYGYDYYQDWLEEKRQDYFQDWFGEQWK